MVLVAAVNCSLTSSGFVSGVIRLESNSQYFLMRSFMCLPPCLYDVLLYQKMSKKYILSKYQIAVG